MFNRHAVAQEHAHFESIGGGMPKSKRMRQVVQGALSHFERAERTEEIPLRATREQANVYLQAREQVVERVGRLGAKHDAELQVAGYIDRVLLEHPDPYLSKLSATMRICHGGGNYGWSPEHEKTIIQWDAKCECRQLCPHAANEETQRMTERYVPRIMELHEAGYVVQWGVLTQRTITPGGIVQDKAPKEILAEIRQERTDLQEEYRVLAGTALMTGRVMPSYPKLPELDVLTRIKNKLHKEQHKYFRKLDKLIKMRWPRSIAKRLEIQGWDDNETNRKRASELKGRIFPAIVAHLSINESPYTYDGHWHPHLNSLFVLSSNYIDWHLFQRLWGGICKFQTEREMYTVTKARLRAKGENVDALSFEDVLSTAMQELIKYPVQPVPYKSGENVGAWTGGEPGQGVFLNEAGDHVAPPMIEWPAEAFLEWWGAQHYFRRTRSYGGGVLYAWKKPEPVPIDPASVAWLGRIQAYYGRGYVAALPLIVFIEGHNSVESQPISGYDREWGRGPPQSHEDLVREIRLADYVRESKASGFDPERGVFI